MKTEFGRFGEVLANTKKQLETVTNSIGKAEVRTRAIERKLRDVEALPTSDAQVVLGKASDSGDEEEG